MEICADASMMRSLAYRIYENGKALKKLVEEDGVILMDTPPEYFTEYMAAVMKSMDKYKKKDPFFKKVWESQKKFADIAVPFWAGAQTTNAKLGMAYANQKKKK
jgi:TRAP-type mannitol/chloroaromatic compound transport system substrate-binding protein